MKEEIIDGIRYRLDENNKTAAVIKKVKGYEGDFIIPEIVVFKKVAYRVTSIRWWLSRVAPPLPPLLSPIV